jgi:tetratricopeptide (TPR) repeat protein
MSRDVVRLLAAAVALIVVGSPAARANPASEALRNRAAQELYNLDRERAVTLFREAIAADPDDAAAHRGLASALWLSITFSRGTMMVDSYLGRMSRQDVRLPPPPAEVADEFQRSVDRALTLARSRLITHPKEAEGHYEVGAAVGLRASYAATVLGSVRSAFGSAREAYNAHEKVLALNPARHDAGLVVGTYRYIVAALALPLRLMAYAAGFGGGREKGLELIEQAANYRGDNRVDARFALVLLYSRERQYDDALKHLDHLRREFPRNRLLWLETGATLLRLGNAAEAERVLDEGIGRLPGDDRPRMFGEEAIWFQKRGQARVALGQLDAAEADLKKSLSLETHGWIHGRDNLELGKAALKRGSRETAKTYLRQAVTIAERERDESTLDEARRLLR